MVIVAISVRHAIYKPIFDVFTVSDRLIDRDGPRRGCPNNPVQLVTAVDKFLQFRRVRRFHDLERHVDLGRGDVFIFDFRFGQRSLFDRGPHDGLGAAIELAALRELQQFADDGRLGIELHGEVGVVPIAHDAQPLELVALHAHPFVGIGAALGAELGGRHLVLVQLLLPIFLLDLPFDRQAVAVPAGHIGRVLAQKTLGTHDDVLQHLVHRMAHMDVAIGVGRAIMQDEALTPRPLFAQPVIKAHRLPLRRDGGFLLGKARLHREVGLRQEDGGFIVFGGLVGHGCAYSGSVGFEAARTQRRLGN